MYNDNRFNYDKNNIKRMTYMGRYPNNKRSISPKIINNRRIDIYNCNNEKQNMFYKNVNIKEEQLNSQYQDYTNPMNYIYHHNSQYHDYIHPYNNSSNKYYPNQLQQNFYFEPIIPPSNQYIFTDGNRIYNYFPQIIPRNLNNKTIKHFSEEKNKNKKNKIEKNKNGINLNISNYETQYPMTFFTRKPSTKKRTLIQNYNNNINNYIVNTKEFNNSYSKVTGRNSTTRFFQAKKKIYNISEDLSNISKKKKAKIKISIKIMIIIKKD